jgi:hypothetical protein
LGALLVLGAGSAAGQDPGRAHVDRKGVVEMMLPPDSSFVLFQAEGERRWVDGWSPEYLFANGSNQGTGTVFTIDEGQKDAVWIVTAHDAGQRHVSYAYVIPGVRVAQVDVDVAAANPGYSSATVRYRMTSLSEDADDWVRSFAADFDSHMAHWKEAIDAHVVRGVPLPGGA